jgi:sulfatase maturation enzyme AslB (radical SAM superfamily)
MHPTAHVELPPTEKDFLSGLLLDVVDALKRCPSGALLAITLRRASAASELESWARFTGNAVVARGDEPQGTRLVIRNGEVPAQESPRPIGSRLWLYTNFDCNLACDYCCVRSSPRADRRPLPLEVVRRIADEARDLGVEHLLLTGGEPFLVPDIEEIVSACAASAPTTLLTNAMLFAGRRRDALARMSRERITLQISLDSATPSLHELHRGRGTWARAWRGVQTARALGFRVRLAATVSSDADERSFRDFLDREGVAEDDRIIRRVALRGFAEQGVALSRADLAPEVTVTANGVYWHPVGATDDDFLVTRDAFPLSAAIDAIRSAYAEERAHADALAQIFHCA